MAIDGSKFESVDRREKNFTSGMTEVLLQRREHSIKAQACMTVFTRIEGWHDPRRRFSGLGYLPSPVHERSQQSRFNTRELDPQSADAASEMVSESSR